MNFTSFLLSQAKGNEKIALFEGDHTISYNDLHNSVMQLASYLCSNIVSGSKIILLSDNSIFFVISYLAIIRSENIAIPLDPKISDTDLIYHVQECNTNLIFAQNKYILKIQNVLSNIQYISELTYSSLSGNKICDEEIDDNEIAEILFTSGSTGKKKGVMTTHGNLIGSATSIVNGLRITNVDRICAVLPFYYCYGLSLLYSHLKAGGSIVISNHPFVAGALNDINKYKCTRFTGVPSTFQILLAKTKFLESTFPSLKYFTVGGGKLPNCFIEQIIHAFPDITFITTYGATETTATMSALTETSNPQKIGSIGKGLPGVQLRVIDEHNRDIHPGETGEIISSSKNVMTGYYMDPEETQKTLKNGWYHTGDLATVDEDGYIFIVGRIKNIIKSGGFRVSPYEIEEEICNVTGVEDVVIIGQDDELMGEAIIAFVKSSTQDQETLLLKIQEYCKCHLQTHKIPKSIHILDEFPLNSSNKVDRNKLKLMIMK